MAGIYFHIPFCKQACHYCDFHFSTSLQYREEMIAAMRQELKLRKDYLKRETIETLYFGGGTPSLLAADEIKALLETVLDHFPVAENAEITLEANPDDLSSQKVNALRHSPVNRFSIGIQYFFQEDLSWMNRAHTAEEADSAVKRVQDAGFDNITVDLIYGFPLLSDEKWEGNIEKVIDLKVPHLSAYSMTVEDRTALAFSIRKGMQKPMVESQSARQFPLLCKKLEGNGYEQYEISNFSFPGQYSRHNSNYWRGIPYLGIGPSAHSYNGSQRQWNVRNNQKYLHALAQNRLDSETETLSMANRVNEYIMTSLRTKWGMDLDFLKNNFGAGQSEKIEKSAARFLEEGHLQQDKNIITLTQKGKLFADHIASGLFVDEG
jgi:oxygen-independent coproporphyrinogen-3 oxidase